MSEKYKPLNIEGDTYVIPGEEPFNEAEIKIEGEGDWNDLEAFANEEGYVSPIEITKKGAKRLKMKQVGESILGALKAA